MAKKSTDLRMSEIKKQDKNKYSTKETFTFEDGKTLNVEVYFRPSKVQTLLEEYSEQINYAQTNGIEISEQTLHDYLYFLMIKHFTTLGKDIADDFETQIAQLEWLVDSDYFKPIVEEAFLKEEVMKVFDKTTDVLSKYHFFDKLQIDTLNKLQKLELDNRDVIENAFEKTRTRKQIPEV